MNDTRYNRWRPDIRHLAFVIACVCVAAGALWWLTRPVGEPERARRRFADLQRQVAAATGTKVARASARGQVLRLRAQARTGDPSQRAQFEADAARVESSLDWGDAEAVRAAVLGAPLLPLTGARETRAPAGLDETSASTADRAVDTGGCRACHVAIDRTGFEAYPQPYRTHPSLEAYVGRGSPHPSERVACAQCHQGRGDASTFATAGHPSRPDRDVVNAGAPGAQGGAVAMLPLAQTEAGCASCHVGERYLPGASTLTAALGTYERGGCWACHGGAGFDDRQKRGPDLRRIRGKLTPEWVRAWLRNPRAIKPATWMPRFWGGTGDGESTSDLDEQEIAAVTAYLFARAEPAGAAASPPRGDAARGEQVVRAVGCLGCHVADAAPRDEVPVARTFGQPLQGLARKLSATWTYDWVRNPARLSPATRMPNLRLSDSEAADVAAYLVALGADALPPPARSAGLPADDGLREWARRQADNMAPSLAGNADLGAMSGEVLHAEVGRRLIARFSCYNCHEISGFEDAPRTAIPLPARRTWTEVDLQQLHVAAPGSEAPTGGRKAPLFGQGDGERARLALALTALTRPAAEASARPPATRAVQLAGRTLVQRRNCVGCHAIEGTGGDFVQLVAEPSLGPPLLTPEGSRVRSAWLRAFLHGPITIRPWLAVRMPTFGLDEAEVDAVGDYFRTVASPNPPPAASAAAPPAEGRALFDLLKCQQCHVLGAIPKDQPTSNLAPDLRTAHERLQPEWILSWLRDPAAILPGTRMPSFWPDYPQSFYPPLEGDGARQVRAIRDHLLTLRGGPSPSGPR